MSSKRILVSLFCGLVFACWSGGQALAQEVGYLQRLRLPVVQDDIGFGHSVTVDSHTGEVLVCDPRTHRILIFDRDGYFTFQILGSEEFRTPYDVAVDPDGLLVVIAHRGNHRLPIELDFDGEFRREIPLVGVPDGFSPPRLSSIALSPDGTRMFLVDDANLHLWITDRDGEILRAVSLVSGAEEDRRNVFLGHVDVYGEDVLLVVASAGEVRRYDLSGELLGVTGLRGSSRCHLARPFAAALTAAGEVVVIDQQRMVLTLWKEGTNRCLNEYLGIGASPGYLYFPLDLALDMQGRFYIAQSWDGRVQVFEGLGPAAWTAPGREESASDEQE